MSIKQFIEGIIWVCTGKAPGSSNNIHSSSRFRNIDISSMKKKMEKLIEKASAKKRALFVAYCIKQLPSYIEYPDERIIMACKKVEEYANDQCNIHDIELLIDEAKDACAENEIQKRAYKEIDHINENQIKIEKGSNLSNIFIRVYSNIAGAVYAALLSISTNSLTFTLSTAKLTVDVFSSQQALEIVLFGSKINPEEISLTIYKELCNFLMK